MAAANAHPVPLPSHWDSFPRALAVGENIRVVSSVAGKLGVRAGMSVPEARVYCANLDVREWDDRAITDAVMAMTGQLLQGSPQVTSAPGAPGTWWVGASGFDNVGGEYALGEQLLRIARAWHPDSRVAIADSCVAARAATWAPLRAKKNTLEDALTIVPVGECAKYLAPAPLGLLPMTEEAREALQALGLRTIGSLAELNAGDVERRWGADGISAWRLAHGDDPRRPGLVRTEIARVASAELASATDNMAPLLFLIRSALNRLVQQLLHDGRAAASVAITLSLDARPQHTITREIRPARPLARVAPLFDQCRALLEKWTLEAPVFAVTVTIPATAPLTADQGDLLVPSWRDAAATVDAVFVRLRAALDSDGKNDVVVHPKFGNAHRPELAGQWEPADALRLAELGSMHDVSKTRNIIPSTRNTNSDSDDNKNSENGVVNIAANASANQLNSTKHSGNTLQHISTESSVNTSSPDSRNAWGKPPQAVPADLSSAALRLLEKAERVVVYAKTGTPETASWRGRVLRFSAVHGPERLSGDWWRENSFARDYWRCTVESEGDFLLYRDTTGWFLQGWYD
ncbi:MAG: hypothetical protein ABJB66_11205 [Gemmatimonadaceae bacterium]